MSTPAVIYPHGYRVSVTGARVVSAPNAAQLVLVSLDGTASIAVTVTPVTG